MPISLHITVPCTTPTYIAVLADMPNLTCVSPLGFQESAHLESKDPIRKKKVVQYTANLALLLQ